MRVLAGVLGFVLVACISRGGPRDKTDAGSRADAALTVSELDTLDGGALFGKLCAVCHGEDGTGYRADNAVSLVNKTYLESATDDQIRRSIVHGRPGTAMAGYGKEVGGPLDALAVAKLSRWIRSHGSVLPLPLPPVPNGDPKRGQSLYAAHCEKCHGTETARGTAVHLMNPKFLEASPDPFLKWALVHGRPGTPMEAWENKLKDTELNDLVSYLRSFDKTPRVVLLDPPTGKEPIVLNPRGKDPTFKLRADPCGPDPKCKPDERYVSVDQVNQALSEKRRMVIIDARSPSDWMRVHIPGALSIPHYETKRLAEIPNDGTWVIAYCACPHHLSGDVVNELRKRGYKHAVILDEGILEWHRRLYPVTTAPGVEPPPRAPFSSPVDAGAPSDAGNARDASTKRGTP
ncbi:MAG: c-type cytochrome [Polyangiaceae bacterium]